MLVVHAALDGSTLLVWGESALPEARAVSRRRDAAHPFAVGTDRLSAVLGIDGGSAADAVAWLPTRGTMPIPSTRLLGDPPRSRAALRLHRWRVPVLVVDASEVAVVLARCAAPALRVHHAAPGRTLAALSDLARHAAALVVRQRVLPTLVPSSLGADGAMLHEARWTAAPNRLERAALRDMGRRLPHAASAVMHAATAEPTDGPPTFAAADRAERFVDGQVDAHMRRAARAVAADQGPPAGRDPSLHGRWLAALAAPAATVAGPADALDRLAGELDGWQARVRDELRSPFRVCFRLQEPAASPDDDDDGDDETEVEADEQAHRADEPQWTLRYLVQSVDEPSILVDAASAWRPTGADRATLERLGFHAGMHLLAPLGEAARVSEAVADSLAAAAPAGCTLRTGDAHDFLASQAPLLEQAGFGVFVPAWWRSRRGRWQLSAKARVTGALDGGRQALATFNLDTLVGYRWQVAIGDADLSRAELERLAEQKLHLVRVRGHWVELDPAELRAALAHIRSLEQTRDERARSVARGSGSPPTDDPLRASIGDLLGMAAGAGTGPGGLPVAGVAAEGGIAELLTRLHQHEPPDDVELPAGLRATLRPYQRRGYAWLHYMAQLGLGACLADDMGLGKSVQTLAVIQRAWEQHDPESRRPTLIVCPTSVLTNCLHECQRFTPDLPVLVHHGSSRLRGDALTTRAGDRAIVLTSYAVLARDHAQLEAVPWRMVVLDEAQNIKNPGTRHARAARRLQAPARVALTGTPVENGVGDLWSIMQFLNPGLLGTQADFRRRYLIPIQAGTFPEAGERLRRITQPFLLRREKTDRTVIDDLPDRFESTVHCLLTTEQASLYEAVVRETERILVGDAPAGIERRGVILATLSKLKQVCNHPAQFLADNSRIADRSGKLARLEELLEHVLESGERALVFTQFVGMGELLQRHLQETFAREVLFLHGGLTRRRRDEVVTRFQNPASDAPPVLVLSLKAGGSGLNLTAASHVFHFDRWWNPATEQQASDRAFRIGQTRTVQVHAFVCAGTIEEQISIMIRDKRDIARRVVGTGEAWLGDLGDAELLELLQLRRDTLLTPGRLDDTGKEWRARRR